MSLVYLCYLKCSLCKYLLKLNKTASVNETKRACIDPQVFGEKIVFSVEIFINFQVTMIEFEKNIVTYKLIKISTEKTFFRFSDQSTRRTPVHRSMSLL